MRNLRDTGYDDVSRMTPLFIITSPKNWRKRAPALVPNQLHYCIGERFMNLICLKCQLSKEFTWFVPQSLVQANSGSVKHHHYLCYILGNPTLMSVHPRQRRGLQKKPTMVCVGFRVYVMGSTATEVSGFFRRDILSASSIRWEVKSWPHVVHIMLTRTLSTWSTAFSGKVELGLPGCSICNPITMQVRMRSWDKVTDLMAKKSIRLG